MAIASDPTAPELTVDLKAQTVSGRDGKLHRFKVVEYYRRALLDGLDEISATMTRMDRIEAFERDYRGERSWLTY